MNGKFEADTDSALDSVIKSDYSNINGIVVSRNGSIVYEDYYNGFGPEDAQHVASVTKSIVSALIGIAIDEKYIESADTKVLDFFPEYVPNANAGVKPDITIRHLLTMTAPYAFEDWREPLDQMCMKPDWIQYALDLMGHNGTIGTFKYSTAGAHVLSAIITRATGKSAREFANERLFKPIGMREIPDDPVTSFGFDQLFGSEVKGWVNDPHNYSTGGWGLTLTPRDMSLFGQLYLNRGEWEGQPIISKSWIEESTAMNANQYGYLWWVREENGIFAYSAVGDGGNIICCVPEKGLVVAIASAFLLHTPDRWPLIRDWIIPAVNDKL
ncbi:serine hydrolase domain-containing protein [Paenibacillus radicis (ex Gao et al. 2016)]|uniref:6-aminohexanoate-dimer hydrolase n=1 Tax=Paenibacillus radicis (ex Gao et al. 2016) TaxID=1737354 RepID=A0A917H6D3_9BACL|nr:serine hydrolase [Paenibacillus radicis (ex Gao et al. 2016)]GGG69007.1 6-aminohexanoate-dimer hydrolase [Paenibacillus radicis (ex Gao et al. 2016)]